ncbi:MAG TPA: zinc ribbon domain-containing protein [Kiritimatiellia bacterium]|nr:zinc ribbon domain-containing protein [Kiritimatiellia bacterium]HPS06286.1 zinc ribbon domain-containing protein [Kiritimatiellia bacterium]
MADTIRFSLRIRWRGTKRLGIAGSEAAATDVLKAGVCVSCGRKAGRYARVCPYCGEQVWHPRWFRVGQGGVALLPPALLASLVFQTRPDWSELGRIAQTAHPVCGFLFAAAIGVLLLPVPDGDLVASTRSELRHWQLGAILGGWLMGAYAAAGMCCLRFGRGDGPGMWLSACGLGVCIASMPLFFRIPWRSLMAAGLTVLALGIQQYAG